MTQYLIVPLFAPEQSKIEELTITAANQNLLLQNHYPECLVLDFDFLLMRAKSKETATAIAQNHVIELKTLCATHQHTLAKTTVQPMGEAGSGLFLSAGASLDPMLDCFIYSGHYARYDKTLSKQSDKGLQLNIETEKILMTAEGQQAGFIQHLPEAHTVPDDLSKEKVATENLFNHTYFVTIDDTLVKELNTPLCFPLPCLVPKNQLVAQSGPLLLGFNYSPSYWAARKRAPLFFHSDGTPLIEQPYLFLLQTTPHNVTLAYATRQALAELCAQKYYFDDGSLVRFEDIKMLDTQTRFLAIKGYKDTAPDFLF